MQNTVILESYRIENMIEMVWAMKDIKNNYVKTI